MNKCVELYWTAGNNNMYPDKKIIRLSKIELNKNRKNGTSDKIVFPRVMTYELLPQCLETWNTAMVNNILSYK